MLWIRENRATYAGQWVVVEGIGWSLPIQTDTRCLPLPKPQALKFHFWFTCFPKIRSPSFRVGRRRSLLASLSHTELSVGDQRIELITRLDSYAWSRVRIRRLLRTRSGIEPEFRRPFWLA